MSNRTDSTAGPAPRERLLVAAAWGVAFLCLAVAGAVTLWWPMGRDQGVYSWVGAVIVRGGASYVGAWELKGPATHMIYALSQLLFGRGMWGIRLLDVLMLAASSWLGWRVIARAGCRSAASLGVFVFVAWYWSLGYWETAQPESWVAFFLLAALALIAPGAGPPRTASLVIAGALVGVCALLKPLFSVFALVFVVRFWPLAGEDRSDAVRKVGACLAGSFAVGIAVMGWLSLKGGLIPFIRIQLDFNWAVHRLSQPLGLIEHFGEWFDFFTEPGMLAALPLICLGEWWLWTRQRRFALVTLTALALCFCGITLQSKYYPYHFTPLFAPLALLAGFGVSAVVESGKATRQARIAVATGLAGLAVLANLVVLAPEALAWARYVSGGTPEEEYYFRFGEHKTDFSYQECALAAGLVEERTNPGDAILVWALDPMIYYLSQRMPPSRFGAHYPLTRGEINPFESQWRREFMRDLEQNPPARIVIADHDANNLLPKPSIRYIEDFPEFRAFLIQNYTSEGAAGRFHILKPRE